MNYLVLILIVFTTSYIYEYVREKQEISIGIDRVLFACVVIPLIVFAGLRTSYNDTYSYISGFNSMNLYQLQVVFQSEFNISNVYGFTLLTYAVKVFTDNVKIYLAICSALYIIPSFLFIRKYSVNLCVSTLLFMTMGLYTFSLGGVKQSISMGMLIIGFEYLMRHKYVVYYLFCLIAISFHTYAVIALVLPLLGTRLWNRRTVYAMIIMVLCGIGMSYITPIIVTIIDLLGKEISEETLSSGSVNIIRVFVYLVPLFLIVLNRKTIESSSEDEMQLIMKLSILASLFMILAYFGNPILFGRMPYYFVIGTVVVLPVLVEYTFSKKNVLYVNGIMCGLFFIYCMYEMYGDVGIGTDLFQLSR